MRLTTLTLAMLCCVAGCRESGEKAVVTHSSPAHGIRIVDIALSAEDPPLKLRWQYGNMAAPKTYGTLSPGSSARIVLVEDLAGTCGVYIHNAGTTNKVALDIPQRELNTSRTMAITEFRPSRDEPGGAAQDVLRIEWINSNDPNEKDKTVLFAAFDLVGVGE